MTMLTEDNITNDQIRELRAWALTQYTTMIPISKGTWIAPETVVQVCDDAIEELLDACDREPMPNRARCAEILNGRHIRLGR